MAEQVTLSVSNPSLVLHTYKQIIAFGKYQGSCQLLATLEVQVYPTKAEIEIVFKDLSTLTKETQEDIKKRFQADVELSPGSPMFAQINFPLHSRKDLIQAGKDKSLIRSGPDDFQFPFVTSLKYDIKSLTKREGLSNEEKKFVEYAQSATEKRFPNVTKTGNKKMF